MTDPGEGCPLQQFHPSRNLLLDPLHPAMAQVALVHQEPFQLDQRLG